MDKWLLVNTSTKTLTTGLVGVRAIRAGHSTDLLQSVSKDDIVQSVGIKKLLQLGLARIDKYTDDTFVLTVNFDNFSELYDTPINLDNSDQFNLEGKTINLNDGVGQGGGDLNLEGGSINFNNEISLAGTGTSIIANAETFATANDLMCFGSLIGAGDFVLPIIEGEPQLLQYGSFTLYENNGQLFVKALSNSGKTLNVSLGTFA